MFYSGFYLGEELPPWCLMHQGVFNPGCLIDLRLFLEHNLLASLLSLCEDPLF